MIKNTSAIGLLLPGYNNEQVKISEAIVKPDAFVD